LRSGIGEFTRDRNRAAAKRQLQIACRSDAPKT
jgi:hypothetical protein